MTRRRPLIALLILAAAVLTAAGCARGAKFDYHRIDAIQEGVTTQDDVLDLFGRPYSVRRIAGADGLFIVWEYIYVPRHGEGAALEIRFDESGVVRGHDHRLIQQD